MLCIYKMAMCQHLYTFDLHILHIYVRIYCDISNNEVLSQLFNNEKISRNILSTTDGVLKKTFKLSLCSLVNFAFEC